MSSYPPAWVKTDHKRFPRAKLRSKASPLPKTANVLSLFSEGTVLADARAFSRLMEHLKELDEEHRTVIMVQVENEVGILGDTRDRSEAANKAFDELVPAALTQFLTENWDSLHPSLRSNLTHFQAADRAGNWVDLFGDSPQTDELFMAFHYALFTEKVAAGGKDIYPIPLYTNCWLRTPHDYRDDGSAIGGPLVGGGHEPGIYPSGGPIETVFDVWRKFCPSLDFLSPDNYGPGYQRACRNFVRGPQALFIPEQRRDLYGLLHMWYAFGTAGAIGVSPFSVDTYGRNENHLGHHYKLLRNASSHILRARQNGDRSEGFFFHELGRDGEDTSPKQLKFEFGDWYLVVERAFVYGKPGHGYGLIIQTGADRFTLVGAGYQVRVQSRRKALFSGILSFEEKFVKDWRTGSWVTQRLLNGDETLQGDAAIMPSVDPDYGRGYICASIPARTRMAELTVYALLEGDDT